MIFGYYMYKAESRYYRRIINTLQPKVILEVVSYNRKCMVINEIANEMKITTVELQHGTIGKEHIAYNYPGGYKICLLYTSQYYSVLQEYGKGVRGWMIFYIYRKKFRRNISCLLYTSYSVWN